MFSSPAITARPWQPQTLEESVQAPGLHLQLGLLAGYFPGTRWQFQLSQHTPARPRNRIQSPSRGGWLGPHYLAGDVGKRISQPKLLEPKQMEREGVEM